MNGLVPSYKYGMDKYSGCNIVESVVKSTRADYAKKKPEHSRLKSFILRAVLAGIAVGFIAALHFFPDVAAFSAVRDVLRNVFCYDVFGRMEFGVTCI